MCTWTVGCVEIGWARVTDGRVVVEVDWDGREREKERASEGDEGERGGGGGSQTKREMKYFAVFYSLFCRPCPTCHSLSICTCLACRFVGQGATWQANKMIEQGQVEEVK